MWPRQWDRARHSSHKGRGEEGSGEKGVFFNNTPVGHEGFVVPGSCKRRREHFSLDQDQCL